MNRYLMTLLVAGLMTNIAYAAEATENQALQIASLDDVSSYTGYKTDLLDKKMLNKTMTESLRLVTWDDRQVQHAQFTKSSASEAPSRIGGNK